MCWSCSLLAERCSISVCLVEGYNDAKKPECRTHKALDQRPLLMAPLNLPPQLI